MHLAEQAVIAYGAGGPRAAVTAVANRCGGQLDPELGQLVLSDPDPLLAALSTADPMTAALDTEPPPKAKVGIDALDGLAEAFGDLADLKCRFTLGHSRGVAQLADAAASLSGLGDDARGRLRRAALVHDVGRTSVSTAVWERAGPLSAGEVDLVRLHAYWSERVLERSPALVELAPLAGQPPRTAGRVRVSPVRGRRGALARVAAARRGGRAACARRGSPPPSGSRSRHRGPRDEPRGEGGPARSRRRGRGDRSRRAPRAPGGHGRRT